MEWSPVLAFAVVAAIFAFGDIVASKTGGIISSVLAAIFVVLIFGGALKILPADLMTQSGLMSLIPTFGMALILVNVGSQLDLNDLRSEWKTVLLSLAGVTAVVIIGFTIGAAVFGREFSLIAMVPTSGGMAATIMVTEAANASGRADLAAVAASAMALQILIGLPVSSLCLRKEAKQYLESDAAHKTKEYKKINLQIVPPTPKALDIPTLHLARIAIVGFLAQLCTQFTGISTGVTFLVFGILFAAIGFIERGSLKKAGGEGLLMLATYASVTASFVSMTFAQFGKLLFPVIGFLLLSAVGICLLALIVGKILGWSPWLSIPLGLSCMVGYPINYAVAMEVSAGVAKGRENAEEDRQQLVKHLLPKMLISGAVSVSLASVLLASIVIPIVFK